MANKREVIAQIFWLRTTCVFLKLPGFAAALLELEGRYFDCQDTPHARDLVLKVLYSIQTRLAEIGIDWETKMLEVKLLNSPENR